MKPAEWYESWREPEEFYRAADENLDVFFSAGKTLPKYLRDAYVVGAFARIWEDNRGPCHVRLVPEKLNSTSFFILGTAEKFRPFTVTIVPRWPRCGKKLVISGAQGSPTIATEVSTAVDEYAEMPAGASS